MNFHQRHLAHVSRITLNVKDLKRQVQFYTEVLGLEVSHMTDEQAILNIGESGHQLVLKALENGRDAEISEAGLFHVALLLPDETDVGRLLRHLLQYQIHVSGGDHLVSQAIYFTDLEGNGIEVYADRDADTWSWQSDQVVMDTLELDGNRLLKIAGDRAWHGMPKEAKIGHLHLKTNDVKTSAAFYKQFTLKKVAQLPSAVFMSDGTYHHHIAVNAWQSRKVLQDAEKTYGLVSFNMVSDALEPRVVTTPEGLEMTINVIH
ncbi:MULTISPECIES: VOC family protein [unclassified Staphylococcus]|uniref:VOC family protein n=1 Tax=unclassified Staphylococcus TaxID=91994 RepID=UPI0021D0C8FD|nr:MULTISPECIES: VOC family protein [unclassified Staphylococcus]UXR74363.1 VOC family protein [Staphylococcus sp. IVB6238]UXR76750.1 VOC family protein [Staphylococcus sp. IVB6233]UXR80880.1 VOC family protein [Staphylococcus sp. IVB6218]